MYSDKEKQNEYYRKKYKEDPTPFKEKSKKWEESNKEYRLKYYKEYRDSHKEERSEAFKKWYEENKDKVAERKRKSAGRRRELERERTKTDPNFKLKKNCRRRILHALNGTVKKSAKTQELLGCPIPELKTHLESQFVEGMTWDNYGEWHIDHIKPCASFDLSDPDQQKECFNFSNLQPLWAYDNMSKGAKL
jgi:hypothetical protein